MAGKTLRIERAIEETKAGLRLKGPKTERGKRTITIDDGLVALLVEERDRHRRLAAVLLRSYAKRTRKADTSAATTIASILGLLNDGAGMALERIGSNLGPSLRRVLYSFAGGVANSLDWLAGVEGLN